jgi:hypothetical protein
MSSEMLQNAWLAVPNLDTKGFGTEQIGSRSKNCSNSVPEWI